MNKSYLVHGWLNGSSYDAGKPADKVVKIRAKNESEAETAGDKKINRLFGKCDVIVADEVTE